MMNNDKFADVILALQEIEPVLPQFLPVDKRKKISESFSQKLMELVATEDTNIQGPLMADLISILWEYHEANDYFHLLQHKNDIYRKVILQLSIISPKLGLEEDEIIKLRKEINELSNVSRVVTIKSKGIGKAKTIKIKNIEFDFGKFGELAAGVILSIKEILGEANYIYMAAGILLIVTALTKAATKEISEQNTTVFWGLILSRKNGKRASDTEIMRRTNIERKKIGLGPLKKNNIINSLFELESLGIVKNSKSNQMYWEIIERVKISY